MKKLVNGKMYDTKKSKFIAKKKERKTPVERLYKSTKGQFFVVEDKDFKLVTEREAFKWLQNNQDFIKQDIEKIIDKWFPKYKEKG